MTTPYDLRFPKRYPVSTDNVHDTVNSLQTEFEIDPNEMKQRSVSDPSAMFSLSVADRDAALASSPPTAALPDASSSRSSPNLAEDARSENKQDATKDDSSGLCEPHNEIVPDFNTILTFLQQINTTLNDTKCEINTKLSDLECKFDKTNQEIKECRQSFEKQIAEVKITQDNFNSELGQIKETQTKQHTDLYNFKREVQHNIKSNNEEIKECLQITVKQHSIEIESKLESHQNKYTQQLSQSLAHNSKVLEEQCKSYCLQTHTACEELTKTYYKSIADNLLPTLETQKQDLNALSDDIAQCKANIHNIKQTSTNQFLQGNPIQIVCNGSDNADRQIPHFNGRAINPHEYLNKLKKFYERNVSRQHNTTNPVEYLIDLLETSLEGPASRWLQLIKQDIHSFEQFEIEFLSKFWNRDLQRGLKARIESERFRSNGSLSRTEYFIERVLLLQSITPPMQEEEIVTLLAERFDPLIQDSKNVQNINTIRDFERLLQREDIRNKQVKVKTQHNSHRNNNTTNDETHKPSSNQQTNHHAYQPRQPYTEWSNRPYQPAHQNKPTYKPNYQSNQNYHNSNPRRYNSYQNARNPNYQNPRTYESYPSQEQHQVCSMIREQSRNNTTPQTPPRSMTQQRSQEN